MRRRQLALDAWVVIVVGVLTWPMVVHSGYGLARDMVFTPAEPLGWDQLGLGSQAARAVPLDALLGLVHDGSVAFRLGVWGVLLTAGWWATRALAGRRATIRALAGLFAVWNPFVVERLGMGQWALLAAYAACWRLPTLVARVGRDGSWRDWGQLTAVLGFASITPTGGLIAVIVVTCLLVTGPGRRHAVVLLAVSAAAQLPWLLPSVLGVAGTVGDPRGVQAFAARAEHPGGVLGTLLGTGGIWDPFVVPPSQRTGFGVSLAVLVVLGLVVGARRQPRGLLLAAALGLGLALIAAVPAGAHTLAWVVSHVPGGGILRDGQKWLAPFVVLAICGVADLVDRVVGAIARWDTVLGATLSAAAVFLPVAALPDALAITAPALTPVHYPPGLARSVQILDASGPDGPAVVTLPWSSYRRFGWGNDLSVADPLPRWTTAEVITSDRLQVASGLLSGEDRRSADLGRLLAEPGPFGGRLASAGVGWVLVYPDQPEADRVEVTGLRPVLSTPVARLYAVEGSVARTRPLAAAWVRILVVIVDVIWASVLLLSVLIGMSPLRARDSASPVVGST